MSCTNDTSLRDNQQAIQKDLGWKERVSCCLADKMRKNCVVHRFRGFVIDFVGLIVVRILTVTICQSDSIGHGSGGKNHLEDLTKGLLSWVIKYLMRLFQFAARFNTASFTFFLLCLIFLGFMTFHDLLKEICQLYIYIYTIYIPSFFHLKNSHFFHSGLSAVSSVFGLV